MSTQLEISFALSRPPAATIAELEAHLRGKGWRTAVQIEAATGWSDRKIRKLASASEMIISSPGRTGYKHLLDATADEYAHYRNGRRSQVRLMLAKVIRTDRIYYRRAAATA